MRIELQPRLDPPRWLGLAAPVAAFALALLVGGVLVAALGRSPLDAFRVYFVDPLTQDWSLAALAVKASPLVMIAVGLCFCFRANLWNIGAEGQFVVGGACGGALALATHGVDHMGPLGGAWILPALLALGAIGGALYALIPALLRVALGVNEILSSLMLVYVAGLGLDYLVRGPWRDPAGFNFPVSVNFDPEATLPNLVDGLSLHAGVLITLAVVVLAALVFSRTLFGYEIRCVGAAPRAARFSGFSERRLTLLVFALSGGLAGLAGAIEVAGPIGQLQPSISPGYGFTAIIVAYLGRLQPVGVLVAGLVLALTYVGGEGAQIALKLPLDVTKAFQGVLLVCVLGADVATRYQVRIIGRVMA
ncbi:ABC transporter permease [Lichenibacterium dinghuense]|uniref:ABC transporter permease n=1 Tax=Lichenibacterium dinghuense TaxID=2895977 RepID=UPI001F348B5C|nr:ABC transporter permease [Lichenibacterium sp. 6Y81]